MSIANLNEKSSSELLAIYNARATKPLRRWAGKKSALVERIRRLEPAEKPEKRAERDGSIRAFCDELLLEVNSVDEKSKRPLGLPYSEILRRVKAKFPEAETSINCLRWYATKLNNRHRGKNPKAKVQLPQRPTAPRPKKAAA
jgi:hypothetical protein